MYVLLSNNSAALALYVAQEKALSDRYVRSKVTTASDGAGAPAINQKESKNSKEVEDSAFGPYLRMLPTSFSIPAFYSLSQLRRLHGSPALASVCVCTLGFF